PRSGGEGSKLRFLLKLLRKQPGYGRSIQRRTCGLETLESRQLLSGEPGLVPVGAAPTGALTGKLVFASAGHGWQWNDALNRWATDRPNLLGMVEDFGNQDQLTYYAEHLLRAGATVIPMRPIGRQLNEVVLDNDSADVTFAGSWSNNTAGPTWYDEDYGATLDSIKYRFASINSGSETATATYAPNIPAAGHYPVYTWVSPSSNRTKQLYKVNHTGGQTQVSVDHRLVGNGWVYLGTYYFNAGRSTTDGSVVISNFSTSGGSVVIADAIRFGNGMGDVRWDDNGIGTGQVSGYPREDEGSILWAWRGIGQSTSFTTPSSVLGSSNVSAPLRMAAYMNASSNPYGTSIYLGFHSNATTGDPNTATARGAIGLVSSSNPTPNQSALATAMGRQLNVDMRALDGTFEHTWSTRTSYSLTGGFGEITNSIAAGKFDATINEVAFHDQTQDAQLLRDARVRNQLGRSTYEATLEHLHNFPGTTAQPVNVTTPSPPLLQSVTSSQAGHVTLRWTAGPSSNNGFNGVHGSPATGFRVFASVDGYGFDGGTYVPGGATDQVTLSGYDADRPYYFKIVAENTGGRSMDSEVLTVLPAGPAQLLIVSGFDRIDRAQNFQQSYAFGGGGVTDRVWSRFGNSRDYSVQVHTAVADARPGMTVHSASNEAVESGQVNLQNYRSVIWVLGNESVANKTFSATEQTQVTNFVQAGGNLFVSGSEIAYDLDSQNNGRSFVRNVLGATYVADNAATNTFNSVAGGIFAGLGPYTFSSGSQFSGLLDQVYRVASPDVLTGSSGGSSTMQYVGGAGGTAATQKTGGGGSGNVIVMGTPFESLTGRTNRAQLMQRVLDYFAEPSEVLSSQLYYPGSVFALTGIDSAIDSRVQLAKESTQPQTLTLDNLSNNKNGITGLVFDLITPPGTTLTASDFQFQVSPEGVFAPSLNPPSGWQAAASPSSLSVTPGFPRRVVIQWPDQSITNRWLRVTIQANANTGLTTPAVYYLGHLQGETTGASDGQFTVLVADLLQVRAALSNPVGPGSLYDIDKNGVVLVNDILETRANLARQLTQITVASGGGGGGEVDGLLEQSPDASWLVDFVEESDNLSARSIAPSVDLVMVQWPEQLL
ncbi:MAG TPA: hypothetical protein DCF63_17480, partial [Planctomycetaceae bacterium]|nr:hypothetical protein [Planctomycetaceae bacterium]